MKFRNTIHKACYNFLNENAISRGEFVLSSGKTSDVYVDIKKASLSAEGNRLLGASISNLINHTFVDIVAYAGIVLGGCILASTAAYIDNKPCIFIRPKSKEYGTNKRIESPFDIKTNDSVVLIEDVVTTGKSVVNAYWPLFDLYNVVGIVSVIDRNEGGLAYIYDETGLILHSLFKLSDFVNKE